jgi:hypothetical protein
VNSVCALDYGESLNQTCEFGCAGSACLPGTHDVALVNLTNSFNGIQLSYSNGTDIPDSQVPELGCDDVIKAKVKVENQGDFTENATMTGDLDGSPFSLNDVGDLAPGNSTTRTSLSPYITLPGVDGFYLITVNVTIPVDGDQSDNSASRLIETICPECRIDADCGSQTSSQFCVGNLSVNETVTPTCVGGSCVNDTSSTNVTCEYGCDDGECLPRPCESFLNVDITFFGNYTSPTALHEADMSDNVFVGNDTSPFGQTTVKIPLGANGIQKTDVVSGFGYSVVPGLHILRDEDENGTFVYVSAAGFNDNFSREAIKANFEFENATIVSTYNGLFPLGVRPYERQGDGMCSVNETDILNSMPGRDEYLFDIGGTTGNICSTTSSGEDRVKIYYYDMCLSCSSDSDCPEGQWEGADTCSSGDVVRDYREWSCNSGTCSSTLNERRVANCVFGCSSGECNACP